MIQTTEAIVLTSKNFSETSKIVHLYTKDFGKFSGIAKGATSPKSKFGKLLQPTNYLLITFYQKQANQLQLLTDAEIIENYWHLRTDLDKATYALAIIETIYKLFEEYYTNSAVFELIINTYRQINNSTNNANLHFISFLIHLLDLIGYTIDVNETILLYEKNSLYFDLSNGHFTDFPVPNRVELTKELVGKIFALTKDAESIEKMNISKNEYFQLMSLFQKYIKEHTDKVIFWDSLGILL